MPEPPVDLEACVNGDPFAWRRFVDRFGPVIHAAVRRTVLRRAPGDDAALDDIAQEVFVRLVKDDFRLLRTYDPARAALTTWLTLVARSASVDHMRRRRPDEGAAMAEEPVTPRPPREDVDRPEPPVHVLTARQRLVLHLLFDADRTVEEAARLMNVDAQTVRSLKHKALSRLRKEMIGP